MHHLAEFNIARLRTPLEADENAEFVSVLEAVNRIAEVSPGFVWRLTSDDDRSASYVQVYDDPLLIVNFSVWTDLDSLRHYVYRSGHGAYFRRRREWFDDEGSALVCWWIPAGEIPTTDDAVARLARLHRDGPSPDAFTFTSAFGPDGAPA
ncbi:MAG: DUF3291 domain-containing protein [Acidimicrobiales bacterium]